MKLPSETLVVMKSWILFPVYYIPRINTVGVLEPVIVRCRATRNFEPSFLNMLYKKLWALNIGIFYQIKKLFWVKQYCTDMVVAYYLHVCS